MIVRVGERCQWCSGATTVCIGTASLTVAFFAKVHNRCGGVTVATLLHNPSGHIHSALPPQAVHLVHISLVSTRGSMGLTMHAGIELFPSVGRVICQLTGTHTDVRFAYCAAVAVTLVVTTMAPTL